MIFKISFISLLFLVTIHQSFAKITKNSDTKYDNKFRLSTPKITAFFKNRIFIELQIHCQNWMIDTNIPSQFKVLDDKWIN
jgi:hypothetical protein